MSSKKIISIGIPAYNEEANIRHLLKTLSKQKQISFVLKEIIVVSDGSNDNTNEIVRSFRNRKVRLEVNEKRLGLYLSQKKIIQQFVGEILILINGDVIPGDPLFVEELIEPFKMSSKVGLVSPRLVPLNARNTFEGIINYSVEYKEHMLRKWQSGNNIFHCHGAARAFTRKFAKTIIWDTSIGEDAYTYFCCLAQNYQFIYQPKALLYYRSPDNFTDHQRQSSRFLTSQEIMSSLFGKEIVAKAYSIPLSSKLRTSAYCFIKNPFKFISYIFIFSIIFLTSERNGLSTPFWEISKSSKILNEAS